MVSQTIEVDPKVLRISINENNKNLPGLVFQLVVCEDGSTSLTYHDRNSLVPSDFHGNLESIERESGR